MNNNASLKIFVYYALPMMIVAIGLPANVTALIMFIRNEKNLEKIGPMFMYRLMFGADTTFLLNTFVFFLDKNFHLSLYLISNLSCKIYFYFYFVLFTVSPLVLAYISLDRFVSIKYYAHRLLLKNSKYQYIYVLSFVLFNFLYNVPVFLNYDLFNNSETKKTKCNLFGQNQHIVPYIEISYVILIFSALFVLTFSLLHIIFSSRERIQANFTRRENRHFKKDLRLAFTSIFFNIFYSLLYFPGVVTFYFFS